MEPNDNQYITMGVEASKAAQEIAKTTARDWVLCKNLASLYPGS